MYGLFLIVLCIVFAALGKYGAQAVGPGPLSNLVHLLCFLASAGCMVAGAFVLATHMH